MRLWMIVVLVLLAGCVGTEGEERLDSTATPTQISQMAAGDVQRNQDGTLFVPDRGDGCSYVERGRTPLVSYEAGTLPATAFLWAEGCKYGFSVDVDSNGDPVSVHLLQK